MERARSLIIRTKKRSQTPRMGEWLCPNERVAKSNYTLTDINCTRFWFFMLGRVYFFSLYPSQESPHSRAFLFWWR